MDIRLLKINAMKRFYKFMNTNMVALNLWSEYNPVGKIYAGLEKRQEIADKRFKFCMERSRTRPGWKVCYLRYCQLAKADTLLDYVKQRKERHGHN